MVGQKKLDGKIIGIGGRGAISKGVPLNVAMGVCGLKNISTIHRYMDTYGLILGIRNCWMSKIYL